MNMAVPDLSNCAGMLTGVCFGGKCKACDQSEKPSSCFAGMGCHKAKCVPHSCDNGMLDDQETDYDCGGPVCGSCGVGNSCLKASDCAFYVCIGGICKAPTHTDGAKNGDETGVDCGYPGGPQCEDGDGCANNKSYCKSGVCYLGLCQEPSCTDTVQNGDETGPDCGGECSPCLN